MIIHSTSFIMSKKRLTSSMSVPLLSLRKKKKKMEMNDWISNRSSEEIELELKVEFFETKGD